MCRNNEISFRLNVAIASIINEARIKEGPKPMFDNNEFGITGVRYIEVHLFY